MALQVQSIRHALQLSSLLVKNSAFSLVFDSLTVVSLRMVCQSSSCLNLHEAVLCMHITKAQQIYKLLVLTLSLMFCTFVTYLFIPGCS